MNSVFEYLFLRRPVLNYVSPPVCEVNFSGTGSPVIVLDPISGLGRVTGLVRGGVGGLTLSWNNYPGALCYSIYQANNENEPFGAYHIIAECIPGNNFQLPPNTRGPFRVTAITPDGETDPSDPIYGPAGVPVVTVDATVETTSFGEANGVFTFYRTQPLTLPLFVHYVVTGTAVPGVDYTELSGEVIIPAGLTSVEVEVEVLVDDPGKTVIVTVIENVNDEYISGDPDEAAVLITDPQEWFKMEETGFNDRIGTIAGTVLESAGTPATSVPGIILQGARLAGDTSDNGQLETDPNFQASVGYLGNGYTICLWIKFNSLGAIPTDFVCEYYSDVGPVNVYLSRTKAVGGELLINRAGLDQVNQAFIPVVGQWYFFTWGFDSDTGNHKLSIDNSTFAEGATTGDLSDPGNGRLIIYSGLDSDITVDEVGIFQYTLSPEEITFLYNEGAGRTYPF